MISKSNKNYVSARAISSLIVQEIVEQAKPLNVVISQKLQPSHKDYSFICDLVYGTIRNYYFLDGIYKKFTTKPLQKKYDVVRFIILVGLFQIANNRNQLHAVINETVNVIEELNFPNLKPFGNAILRNYSRNIYKVNNELFRSYETKFSFPQWFIQILKDEYKSKLSSILESLNKHPPMWIRINSNKFSLDKYITELQKIGINATKSENIPSALLLDKPLNVCSLPFFNEGVVFVQDAAAQFASYLLDAQKDDIVLDCCCAPGGKTTHIIELYPSIKELVAIDNQEQRLKRVKENLSRLNQSANVICCDASGDTSWSPYSQYDRILLDAPCSATGVIRRHPDIKLLRQLDDIHNIVQLQYKILENMWKILKTKGILVYVTCSILPQENKNNIKRFLSEHKDAKLIPITSNETSENPGFQRLPCDENMDGFYYAKLQKI